MLDEAGIAWPTRARAPRPARPRPSPSGWPTELLALPEPPTAIFASSDVQATGVLGRGGDRGPAGYPTTCRSIGFDDIELSTYVGLTTVRQPLFDSGYLGGRLLLEALAQPPTRAGGRDGAPARARARRAAHHRAAADGRDRGHPRRGRAVAEIVLDDVWKVYPDGTEAVRALDLAIDDKEFIVLVGPVRLRQDHRAAHGRRPRGDLEGARCSIGDRVVNDVPPKERDIAMVFQNYALYPHMSVFDNMAFGLKLQKLPKAEIDERVRRGGAHPRPRRAARRASRPRSRAVSASGSRWAGPSCATRRRS